MDALDNTRALLYDSSSHVNPECLMPILLSPDVQRQIEERVESGEYDSADDVVRYAMSLLAREDEDYATRLEALRGEIQKGIDSLDAGRRSSKDEVFARLRARRERTPV